MYRTLANLLSLSFLAIESTTGQQCFDQSLMPKLLSAQGQPDSSWYTAITGT